TYPADADLKFIGAALDELGQLRNKADYDLSPARGAAAVRGRAQQPRLRKGLTAAGRCPGVQRRGPVPLRHHPATDLAATPAVLDLPHLGPGVRPLCLAKPVPVLRQRVPALGPWPFLPAAHFPNLRPAAVPARHLARAPWPG